jgi:hypothetical protein
MFLIVCAMALSLGPAPEAMAQGGATSDGLAQEHRFERGGPAPPIEERIVAKDGTVYLLKELGEPVADFAGNPARSFVVTMQRPVHVETARQGLAAVRALFSETLSLDAGDYIGILYLDSLETEPLYIHTEEQIERSLIFANLPSEDVLQLPEYEDFLVASDEAPGATERRMLKRVAVSWRTTDYDPDGRPVGYEATVVFRGAQRQLVPDYHVATLSYKGIARARLTGQSLLASYVPLPSITPTLRPTELPKEEVPSTGAPIAETRAFDFVPLIAGASVVISLMALLAFVYFFCYCNARLVRILPSGRRKVLVRRRLTIEGDELRFRIAPSVALYHEGATHLLLFGRRLAGSGCTLILLWGKRQVLRCEIGREIDVTQELLSSLGDAVDGDLYLSLFEEAGIAGGLQGGRL